MPQIAWYQKDISFVEEFWNTHIKTGLSEEEAEERLKKLGPNLLKEKPKTPAYIKYLLQFTDFMNVVLIIAAFISGFIGEWIDTAAILAIVFLNATFSFIQEYRAEKALSELKKMTAPTAKVKRGGHFKVIPAENIVPGDVIDVEAGDSVPADSLLIEAYNLKVDESSLTGESSSVRKKAEVIEEERALADISNMLFMATTVTYGKATAIVTNTGMHTELGKIAGLLQKIEDEETPLQKKIASFGKWLVYFSLGICALVFLLGVLRGEKPVFMLLTAISLAIAAIPEGLPAVITIALALGVKQMADRNALIRRLTSVETLGSASVICTDKTGTLTCNKMTVRKIYFGSEEIEVTGTGYEPVGEFRKAGQVIETDKDEIMQTAFKIAVLCSNAVLSKKDDGWGIFGDHTEGALLTMSAKGNVWKEELKKDYVFVTELPFDSSKKLMTSVYQKDEKKHVFTKGAPDMLLPLCSRIMDKDGETRAISEDDKAQILDANEKMAENALRVLGLAYKETALDDSVYEKDLIFVGLAGMMDPPRSEVKDAVQKCREAGIRTVIITGDHKITAIAVAKEIGAFSEGDLALTGLDLDQISDPKLTEIVDRVKIFARVTATHKLRLVRAWRQRGQIVAMTGDGVNDAPALKEADIGIAMGITGTDVTRASADMVLADDNFATIVNAVEEGRRIYDNIKKFIHFLLSCNIGEILTMLISTLLGVPLPLLPIHILWTNLVTDGLPALALGFEPREPNIMKRPPRSAQEELISKKFILQMVYQGSFMALCTIAAFAVELYIFQGGIEKARTMAFTVLIFCQKFHVFNCRSEKYSVFKLGFFTNPLLITAVLTIFATQIAIIYVPFLQKIFKTVPLTLKDWVLAYALSTLPLVIVEIIKWIKAKKGEGNRE